MTMLAAARRTAPGEQERLGHVGAARQLRQPVLAAAGGRHRQGPCQGRHMLIQCMRHALHHVCMPGRATQQSRPSNLLVGKPCTATAQLGTSSACAHGAAAQLSTCLRAPSSQPAGPPTRPTAPHPRRRQGLVVWTSAGKRAAATPPHSAPHPGWRCCPPLPPPGRRAGCLRTGSLQDGAAAAGAARGGQGRAGWQLRLRQHHDKTAVLPGSRPSARAHQRAPRGTAATAPHRL